MADWYEEWRLISRYTPEEASYLVLDCEPHQHLEEPLKRSRTVIEEALVRAIRDRELPAEMHFRRSSPVFTTDIEPHQVDHYEDAIDFDGYFIKPDALQRWLADHRRRSEFFAAETSTTSLPAYLNDGHDHYAKELAFAVKAWVAVSSNSDLLRAKTPKQALSVWLKQNAGSDLSPSAISRISRIANWRPEGGAPATPNRSRKLSRNN